MKQLHVLFIVLAVAAFAAGPVLAKGGHSGGHAHHSGGHAHKSGSGHAAHHAKPKPAKFMHSATSKTHPHAKSNATTHPGAKTNHANTAKQPQTTTAATTGSQHATRATTVSHRGSYHRGYGRRNNNRNRRNYARNGRPSFVAGPDQVVGAGSGPQTVAPWATRISAGSGRQGQQGQQGQGGLQFQVTSNSNPALFSAPPSVSPSGVLSFTPAAGQAGTATVSVVLRSGTGTSVPRTFHITVGPA